MGVEGIQGVIAQADGKIDSSGVNEAKLVSAVTTTGKMNDTDKPTDCSSFYDKVMAEKAVENANNRVRVMGTSAKFAYNKDIDRITITITDKSDNEVVKEIPTEETQKMLERIHSMQGMLMDEEA